VTSLLDLPLLTAMMRERGLPVASCQLTDRRYQRNGVSQRTVIVTWAGDNGFHQRNLAAWMAGCDVIHQGFQSSADQSDAA